MSVSVLWLTILRQRSNELATALRKGPFQANLLLAGFDAKEGASLYYIDYLGSMQRVETGAHGYGSYFTLRYIYDLLRAD